MSTTVTPLMFSTHVLNNISVFKSYLHFGESNVDSEEELLRNAYSVNSLPYGLMKNDPEKFNAEVDRLHNEHYDAWHLLVIDIRSRFRESVIIQLYSYMEYFLTKQCEVHWSLNGKGYSIRDLKGGNDLEKVVLYYKHSVGIDIKKLHQWNFITKFKTLRNTLVHQQGKLDNKQKYNDIKNFVKGNFELRKDGTNEFDYQIVLSEKEFIGKCINEVEMFLYQLTMYELE